MSNPVGSQSGGERPVDAVRARVSVRALDLAALDDETLLGLVRDAEEAGRVVDAARVLLAGEVARRSRESLGAERLCARYGCRNAAELITRLTHVSRVTARERIRAAEPLMPSWTLTGDPVAPLFPEVAAVLEGGLIGLDSVRAITRSLAAPLAHGADPAQVAVAEREIVAVAMVPPTGRVLDQELGGDDPDGDDSDGGASDDTGTGTGGAGADDVAVMSQVWQAFLDPDGAAPDEDLGIRRRGLTLGREYKGTVKIQGYLLPEVGAQMQRLLDAYLNPRVDRDPAPGSPPASGEGGDGDGTFHSRGPALDRDGRTQSQRRHDAFAGMLTIAAGHDDAPRIGGAAPTLVVTVSAEDLLDPLGPAFIQGGHDLDTIVSSGVARHISCSGATQILFLGEGGRIEGISSPQRVFTPHQRRAITMRDGGCVIPGCGVPATWCEIHHVLPHHQGGPTHTDNGVLLCWFHHRTLDDSGWTITMEDGIPHVTAPPWIDPEGRPRTAPGSRHRQWRRNRTTRGAPRPGSQPSAPRPRPVGARAGERTGVTGATGRRSTGTAASGGAGPGRGSCDEGDPH